jgi:hypothetical protein
MYHSLGDILRVAGRDVLRSVRCVAPGYAERVTATDAASYALCVLPRVASGVVLPVVLNDVAGEVRRVAVRVERNQTAGLAPSQVGRQRRIQIGI